MLGLRLHLVPVMACVAAAQMVAYEAGFGGIGDGSATDLAIKASLDPRMGPVYNAYLSMLVEEGVSLIAHFVSVGPYSRYGSFPLKIGSDQVCCPLRCTPATRWLFQVCCR
jgi:hypothetical protein